MKRIFLLHQKHILRVKEEKLWMVEGIFFEEISFSEMNLFSLWIRGFICVLFLSEEKLLFLRTRKLVTVDAVRNDFQCMERFGCNKFCKGLGRNFQKNLDHPSLPFQSTQFS